MTKPKQDMADIVAQWLMEKGLESEITKEGTRSVFRTQIQMINGTYSVLLCTRERDDFFGVYAYMPFKIAEEHRADWLDITSRANWGYEFARLELDPVDGQFRCSSTAVLPESLLTIEMVEKMTMFLVNWIDPAFPTLQTLAEVENPL